MRKLYGYGWVVLWAALAATAPAWADDEEGLDEFRDKLGTEWVMVKNDRRHNIRTYARREDGKRYRSMKVEATLDASLGAVARVLYDMENYPRWFWKTRVSRMVRKDSPTDFVVYMVHEAPVGLPDRDTVLKVNVEPQTRSRPSIVMRVSAVTGILPEKPPLVRMRAEEITLRLTPRSATQVDLQVEGYFDPGGAVPAWAANFVQRNAPYSVLLGLQRMASNAEYTDEGKPLPFRVYDSAQAIP